MNDYDPHACSFFILFFNIFNLFSMHIFIVQRIDLDFRSMRYISIMIQLHLN